MRFLVDAQLPPALARMLSDHGHLAEHVIDIGPADASDREIWTYALQNDAVLITKDEDFAGMHLLEEVSPAVVWVRTGNTRRHELLEWFVPMISRIESLIDGGNRLIELR